jgi:SAM-dependent methyltransferase
MSHTPYDDDFFASQSDGSYRGAREVLPKVFALTKPRSVLDVGCGQGTWLAAALEQGVSDILGVDGPYVNLKTLKIPQGRFLSCDLQKPLELKRRFDLVISLEVGEHLAESAAQTFADNLVRHGSVVLFSAAVPGQGEPRISTNSGRLTGRKSSRKAATSWSIVSVTGSGAIIKFPSVIGKIQFLYVEAQFLNSSPALAAETSRPEQLPAALVHPELFAEVLSRPVNTRRLLKEAPMAVLRTISARARRLVPKIKIRRVRVGSRRPEGVVGSAQRRSSTPPWPLGKSAKPHGRRLLVRSLVQCPSPLFFVRRWKMLTGYIQRRKVRSAFRISPPERSV